MSVATGFGKSYSDYTSHAETEGAGYTTIAVDVLTAAFFVFFRKSIHIYRDEYDLFLNMFLFAFMIEIVTVFLVTFSSLSPASYLLFRPEPAFCLADYI